MFPTDLYGKQGSIPRQSSRTHNLPLHSVTAGTMTLRQGLPEGKNIQKRTTLCVNPVVTQNALLLT